MQSGPRDLVYNASDTGWGFSLWTTLGAWATGAEILAVSTNKKFNPQKMLHVLCEQPVTIFCAAPTVLRLLAAQTNFDTFKFKALKRIVTVGEAIDERVIKQFAKSGVDVVTGFGQAETTLLIGRTNGEKHVEGTMGRPMYPYNGKVVILDAQMQPVPPGKMGAIAVRYSGLTTTGFFRSTLIHQKTPSIRKVILPYISQETMDPQTLIILRDSAIYNEQMIL